MTARIYIGIEIKERSYKKNLKEYKLVGVNFCLIPYIKDYFIVPMDNRVIEDC